MKKIILTLAAVACMTLPMQAQAFDITGIVKNAVTNAVTDVVDETTTEVTKEVTKTATNTVVKETGITGLTPSTKVLDANGIANVAKSNGLSTTSGVLGEIEPSSGQVNTGQSGVLQEMQPGGTTAPTIQKGSPVSGFLKDMFNSK